MTQPEYLLPINDSKSLLQISSGRTKSYFASFTKKVNIFFLAMLFTQQSFGQAVVVFCKATGAWAEEHNMDGLAGSDGSPISNAFLLKEAMHECADDAKGTACQFFAESSQAGWMALISGVKISNKENICVVSFGNKTLDDAVGEVRKQYKDSGGRDPDLIEYHSFYVYNTAIVWHPDHKNPNSFEFENANAADVKVEKHGGSGRAAGMDYDDDPVPNYGDGNSNPKVEGYYVQMVVSMTSNPEKHDILINDHNDLRSYKELEKNSKVPIVENRKKFVRFLHSKYKIPYPPVYK